VRTGGNIMKKIVKNKIEKYYCDKCGKNIFDMIPVKSSKNDTFFGMTIPEYHIKRYSEFKKIQKGRNQFHYCLDCYKNICRENK
jgi:protein-arginine kinase activator protein McsA